MMYPSTATPAREAPRAAQSRDAMQDRREAAIAAYRRSESQDIATMQLELAARILALAGSGPRRDQSEFDDPEEDWTHSF